MPRRKRYAQELALVVPPATALVPLDKLRQARVSPGGVFPVGGRAERLLLWCAKCGKDLRMLEDRDLEAYEAFLTDPQPSSFCCGQVDRATKCTGGHLKVV